MVGERSTPDPPAAGQPDPRDGGSAADKLWWYRDARQPDPPAPQSWWRRLPRRRLQLDALACLAVSTLVFSRARSETLFIGDWDFYNKTPLSAPMLVALLSNVVGVGAVGFLAVQAIRYFRPPWQRVTAAAAMATFLIALNFARITHESVDRWTVAIGSPGLLAVAVLSLAAALRWPSRALWAIRRLALIASPLAVVTLAHGLGMFFEVAAGPVWRRVDPAPVDRTPPSLRRVVWLVFEELDQRVVFEARPRGLELPEFDRLRRESLYADAARPPAGRAEISMPALITGRPVVAVSPVSPHDLELTFKSGETARWSAQPNVFSRARALGYDTAAIGWHLPYPRVLGSSLGFADWRPSDAHEQARGDTFGQAWRHQWASLAPPLNVRRLVAQRVEELGDLAIRTAANDRFGLVLVHLPIPRPPGIYDPAAERLTTWSFRAAGEGYFDNLALADRTIAELRRVLKRARLDDRTWLIVSADRSWPGSQWYDGHVDSRVPFLVHPPDGDRSTHVDARLSTLATHDLIVAILRGSIRDADEAAAWLSRNPAAPPRDYTSAGRPVY